MATNPTVEKLKALGLKHGEKAVIGLASALFLLFLVIALGKKTIEMRPEELSKKAEQAESNLSARQKPEDILARLETQGLKPQTDFEAVVVKQQSKALNPGDYLVKQKWVTPEPGAGLIRDQPQLISPENLYAFPNRGGYLIYALDEKGERIPDTGKEAPKRRTRLGKSRRQMRQGGGGGMMGSGGGGMMGSGGGMRGGMSGTGGGGSPKAKAEQERLRKEEEERLTKSLVGKADEAKDASKKKEAEAAPQVAYKEVVKGLRSVAITGTLNNKKMIDNYRAALKDYAVSYPNYKRLDVQRAKLGPDGKFVDFEDVNPEENYKILDNLTEEDEELVPESERLDALVDELPFPKAGFWTGVHVASLVPKEKREIAKPPAGGGFGMGMGSRGGMGAMGGMMSGSGSGGDTSGGMGGRPGMGGMSGGPGMGSGMGSGSGMGMGRPGMGSGSGSGSGMGMGSGGGGSSGPADDMSFPRSESETVMVRSLDFTVEPDATYKYRLRIVVVNPNYLRSDVSPGTDTEATELKGEWSEPTEPVTVPADVSAFALRKTPSTLNARRNDQVTYQVARWTPEDGQTVVRLDDAGPGELIGISDATTAVPSAEGAPKRHRVDFNTQRLVLDVTGGTLPPSAAIRSRDPRPFEMPTVSLALRPDGAVVVHMQALDAVDDVRASMERHYKHGIKDSGKRRQPGMGGMMGSGMMGSGSGMGGMGMPGAR